MYDRARIPNRVEPDGSCVVECMRHGVLYAQRSQQGRMYHSCNVWSHPLRCFVPKPTVRPLQRCSVQFVFCAEHRNEQRALSLNAVQVSSARSETPPTPDRDDDSGSSNDAMDEDNRLQHHHIALSSLFTPPSPPNHACATTTYLTVSQQDLVEQFSILADDLYQSST